ncbi:MAG: hypothetical protein C0621_01575 [Desulfuromonas sp.]|nr:MAG: hypothetical protein C0621_01575 [Desulfuromonas sp.]
MELRQEENAIKFPIPYDVAALVDAESPRLDKAAICQGGGALSLRERGLALFILCYGDDADVKREALLALHDLATDEKLALAEDDSLAPDLLDLLLRVSFRDAEIVRNLLPKGVMTATTLRWLAAHGDAGVLDVLLEDVSLFQDEEIVAALMANPAATPDFRALFEATDCIPDADETGAAEAPPVKAPAEEESDEGLSKYQQALEMGVSEKIKMAMTGDKEWRGIFLKDSNKLVSGAVMKNPRITDGEVLGVAKLKTSSDELIRLITLNKDWIKNSEIKKALVFHPRTPLPKALRFMAVLTEKDLKIMAKSKGISQVLVNAARKMLTDKAK